MSNTREKILIVAEELIQKFGVSAMSYQHIADEVGIKKASIHHHFPKKDDLIQDLLNRCSERYSERYHAIIRSDISALNKLEKISEIFSASLKEGKVCIFGMISANANVLNKEAKKALEASLQKTIDQFTIIFEQGKKDKTLRVTSSKDTSYTFFSALQGMQIVARVRMDTEGFENAVKALISSWKV